MVAGLKIFFAFVHVKNAGNHFGFMRIGYFNQVFLKIVGNQGAGPFDGKQLVLHFVYEELGGGEDLYLVVLFFPLDGDGDGTPGEGSDDDPGSGWDVAGETNGTKDHTLVRKASVTSGNTDWSASAGTNATDSE